MSSKKEVQSIVQEYLNEGYVVITHPDANHLPPFAAGFVVDFVASRGEERALVHVVTDRTDLQSDPLAARQAEITNGQAGWRYDVVVLRDDNSMRKIGRLAGEPTIDQINQMLEEAENVLRASSMRAAFVLAWAGLEAVLRRTALHEGIESRAGTQLTVLVRELYSSGRLSPDEFRTLEKTRKLRTEIVHGLAPRMVDLLTVQTLIDMARRLLAQSEAVLAS